MMPSGWGLSVAMTLWCEPSGSIDRTRPPPRSRMNSRPERVAVDGTLVRVVSRIVMVCPSISLLRLDCPRRRTGIGKSQAQRVSHSLFLRLQVAERMHCRACLAGNPFDDPDAAVAQRAHLVRIVGQQASVKNAEVAQDRGRQAEVPEIRLEA